MAKDPAVLFYVNDFLTGSSLLTPLQKGHYITLLCHQQQSDTGSLSLDKIKKIMGKDFDKHWPALVEKFDQDDNGFFNTRMRIEVERRKKNSKTQSDRISKYWQGVRTGDIPRNIPRNNHGNTYYEIETEIERNGGMGEIWNSMPGPDKIGIELPDIKIGAAIELFGITKGIKATKQQIISLWKIFKIQNLTGKNYYADESDTHSHFLNWCKTQNINKVLEENTSSAPPLKKFA